MKKHAFILLSVLVFFLLYSLTFIPAAHANIVLKLIAVNPSKDQKQKVPVKAYMPKETKVEDIVDKGDLDVAYDTQQGSYYVYGEYELKPGEVLEKDIEIRDIWVIPENEIEAVRADVRKTAELLKNTDFKDRAAFLKESVETKLDQVIERQKAPPANPEQHISQYRDNVTMLEDAKKDLALARTMLSQVKPLSTAIIWRLIIGIVIFLGVLAATFYVIWTKQLKTITQDNTFFVPKEDQQAQGEVVPQRHEEAGQKPPEGDVDKVLNKEQKEEA